MNISAIDKCFLKKEGQDLQDYLNLFRRRGSRVEAKKGKGSKYNRSQEKRKVKDYDES